MIEFSCVLHLSILHFELFPLILMLVNRLIKLLEEKLV